MTTSMSVASSLSCERPGEVALANPLRYAQCGNIAVLRAALLELERPKNETRAK
ncbi:MAG TPA: hypothetical protein VER11_16400 [Polyangiaceae bacterium]|nr:hypothetical protein [Polyangiaceae bacterium]